MLTGFTYRHTVAFCNVGCLIQGAAVNISPFLFIPLKLLYNISFTQIGSLVLINFVVQLAADFFFGNAINRFGYRPFLIGAQLGISAGFVIFALSPWIAPGFVFLPLVVGTVFFSCGAGLMELLLNPVITSLPSENKSSSMAFLHTFYAIGLLLAALITTFYLHFFGNENWYVVVLIWAVVPFLNGLLFTAVPLPVIKAEHKTMKMGTMLRHPVFILAALTIFFSAATEILVVQWGSTYLERGLGLDKVVGDVGGLCTYAVMMGIGRFLYGTRGKKLNIHNAMIWGGAISILAYSILALAPNFWLVMVAFGLIGICTCMMWPGILLVASNKLPFAGVLVFGVLCGVGDLGSAVAGQAIGVLSDFFAARAPQGIALTPEQYGLRIAIGASVLIPVLTTVFQYLLKKVAPYRPEAEKAGEES